MNNNGFGQQRNTRPYGMPSFHSTAMRHVAGLGKVPFTQLDTRRPAHVGIVAMHPSNAVIQRYLGRLG